MRGLWVLKYLPWKLDELELLLILDIIYIAKFLHNINIRKERKQIFRVNVKVLICTFNLRTDLVSQDLFRPLYINSFLLFFSYFIFLLLSFSFSTYSIFVESFGKIPSAPCRRKSFLVFFFYCFFRFWFFKFFRIQSVEPWRICILSASLRI